MKFSKLSLLAAVASAAFDGINVSADECSIPPGSLEDVGVKVTYVNKVKAVNTDPSSYNMMVAENFDDKLIFIDQKEGILYEYKEGKMPFFANVQKEPTMKEIYNIQTDALPVGVDTTIPFPFFPFSGGMKKIHQVAPGLDDGDDDTMIVVFTSSTLPAGSGSDSDEDGPLEALELPSDFEYNFDQFGDCTNANAATCGALNAPLCCIGQKVYKLFYRFELQDDGDLDTESPELFFALEMQNTYGHDGGAMLTIPTGPSKGKILYSVGDCLPYGVNGLYASQDLSSHCGKMLLLDPENPGRYDIVAAGIRNSQQMMLEGNNIVFMDIGGVTAEEVNAVSLADLLDLSAIENFGWGMRQGQEEKNKEEFGREGTFAVGKGSILEFGNPPCLGSLTEAEADGFVAPYMQYGRGPGIPLFGITSSVISDRSFSTIKTATSEFNTGKCIVSTVAYDAADPSPKQTYFVNLFKEDENGNLIELTDGFNTLVEEALNIPEGGPIRGDSRLFKYPDGSAGVFIERTGEFFRLSEIDLI